MPTFKLSKRIIDGLSPRKAVYIAYDRIRPDRMPGLSGRREELDCRISPPLRRPPGFQEADYSRANLGAYP